MRSGPAGRFTCRLFIGLAFSATEFLGLQVWRTPFLIRTYGWNEARIGNWSSLVFLVCSLLGALLGTVFVEWLAKRYKDCPRARLDHTLHASSCRLRSPRRSCPRVSCRCCASAGATVCGLAAAVPQNAAIQRITPNEMRGQVTAIYLFMFIFFGALGGQLIGSVTQRIFGNDADLWKSLVLTASILLPLAAFSISRGIKPYGREVERLEKLEAQGAKP